MTRRFFLLSLLLAAVACGSAQVDPENRPRTRSDRVTQAEILRTQLTNMYEVVQRLQPAWLVVPQSRGRAMELGVFVDGVRVGGPEFLRSIPASQVAEARYLEGSELTSALTGSQAFNLGAAIMLSSHRR